MYVTAPLFTPIPYGLLSTLSAEIRTPTDRHWEAGVQWEAMCSEGSTTFDECLVVTGAAESDVAPPPTREASTELVVRGATPFTVYTMMDCSVPGFWDRMNDLGDQAFTQSEQWQVERAFWTGLAGGQPVVYPHLAADEDVETDMGPVVLQTAATVVVTGTVGIIEGMGRLQGALGDCYDGVGVIHVPRTLEPYLSNAGIIIREGNRYRTTQGHIVVFGAGYPGTSPAGASSIDSLWIYATGSMFIYRGPQRRMSGELLQRDNNLATVEVERTYVLGWDCCHLAVNVSLSSEE